MATTAAGTTTPTTTVTPVVWADAFLSDLGVSAPTANQEKTVVDWEAAEGGNWHNTAFGNPLNTTQNAPGATSINSVGVKAYTSWQEGLDATIQTITQHGYGYPQIIADLTGNAPEATTAAAVGSSSWGTPDFYSGASAVGAGSGQTAAAQSVLDTTGGATNASWQTQLGGDLANAGVPGLGLLGQVLDTGTSGTIEKVLQWVAKPFESFIENGFLVVFGLIIVIVGLVLLTKAATGGNASTAASSAAGASFGASRARGSSNSGGGSSSAPPAVPNNGGTRLVKVTKPRRPVGSGAKELGSSADAVALA